MTFKVGETVVYPHHGAATIEEITTRVIGGVEREYLKLRVAQGDLTIQIPSENVEMVGVRDVVDEAGLEHVFEVLRAKKTDEPSNWSRRYSNRGLSAGEKRMLTKARQILVSELALAEKTNEEDASLRLDEVLAS